MNKYFFLIIIIILITAGIEQNILHAYPKAAHELINEFAVNQSIIATGYGNYLQANFNFDKSTNTAIDGTRVIKWVINGGRKEDSGKRPINHFHNPLEPWEDAGLSIPPLEFTSSLIWAQAGGNDLWSAARDSLYMALTTGQDSYYSDSFLKIGQVMHLVSDCAVPDHVRNDQHLPYYNNSSPYEKWITKNKPKINYTGFALNQSEQKEIFGRYKSNLSAPCPISALWDQDEYTTAKNNPEDTWSRNIGLAEFTNANFFSKDSINKYIHPVLYGGPNNIHTDWANPETVVAEDGKLDNVYYFKADTSGASYRIAISGFITHDLVTQTAGEFKKHIFLDDNVFNDYANILVPRAVGYSAAVIDYFFRGKIDLEEDAENENLGYVIKNNTDADMEGKFELYYENTDGERHKIPGFDLYLTISANGQSENIQFSIPADIDDKEMLTLVFKGKLGEEENAVVGKVVNIKKGYLIIKYNSYYTVWDPKENCLAEIKHPESGLTINLPALQEDIQPWLEKVSEIPTQNLFSETVSPDTETDSDVDLKVFGCEADPHVYSVVEYEYTKTDYIYTYTSNTDIDCSKQFLKNSIETLVEHDFNSSGNLLGACDGTSPYPDYQFQSEKYFSASPFGILMDKKDIRSICPGRSRSTLPGAADEPPVGCPIGDGEEFSININIIETTKHFFSKNIMVQFYSIFQDFDDGQDELSIHACIDWYEDTTQVNPCLQNRNSIFEDAMTSLINTSNEVTGGSNGERPTFKVVESEYNLQ